MGSPLKRIYKGVFDKDVLAWALPAVASVVGALLTRLLTRRRPYEGPFEPTTEPPPYSEVEEGLRDVLSGASPRRGRAGR
jgi:hypothetical protein